MHSLTWSRAYAVDDDVLQSRQVTESCYRELVLVIGSHGGQRAVRDERPDADGVDGSAVGFQSLRVLPHGRSNGVGFRRDYNDHEVGTEATAVGRADQLGLGHRESVTQVAVMVGVTVAGDAPDGLHDVISVLVRGQGEDLAVVVAKLHERHLGVVDADGELGGDA